MTRRREVSASPRLSTTRVEPRMGYAGVLCMAVDPLCLATTTASEYMWR